MTSEPRQDRPDQPQKVGKYRIIGKIGHGSMGEVYRAEDPVLKRHVAIKLISSNAVIADSLDKRFQREAQSIARLNHPNIITIFDFGEDQGTPYMAMELLEGMDLRQAINRRRLRRLDDKLRVMQELCEGLAYAHRHGVIHRDLKPANIHLTQSGQVKIMDFGLARVEESEMTQAGVVLGTPHYMAPEQVRGERADARSDVFALGAVMYELLSNQRPFEAASVQTILSQVLEAEPRSLHTLTPEVPPSVIEIIERALAKDPAVRFQDAGEAAAALRSARKDMASATLFESAASIPGASRSQWSSMTATTGFDPNAQTSATVVRPAPAPPTLYGEAPTQLGPPPAKPRGPALAIVLGLVGLALLAGGVLVYQRTHVAKPPAADVAKEQEAILREALIDSQLELARLALANKDYPDAIAQAERALKIDPGNAQATEVRTKAQAVLQELETTAAQARQAMAAGDAEGASRALDRVLALDPRHPVVAELSSALNQYFKRQAEAARDAADQAARGAQGYRAQAPAEMEAADRGVRDAAKQLQKGEFAAATQKFLEARDGYDKARRVAEAAARAALAARATPPVTEARATLPATTLAVAPPPPAPTGAAPGLPPASLALAPSSLPVPAQPTLAGPAVDEAAIRRVIEEYGQAIQARDLGLFKRVKPNLSKDEESRLKEAFKAVKSQQVSLHVEAVELAGAGANVRVARQDVIDGQAMKPIAQVFRMVRSADGWAIDRIGQ